MLNKILEGKALEQWRDEKFELNISKTKGSGKPGLKYRGSQHGLLGAYLELIEIIIKEDVIPVEILHDALISVATENGKDAHGKDESK